MTFLHSNGRFPGESGSAGFPWVSSSTWNGREPLGINGMGFAYRPDVPPANQPTAVKET